MEKYQVRIGSEIGVYFGDYTVKTTEKLKNLVAEQIEALRPLNSSDEGAELYRQRFRGKPLYIKLHHEKEYKLLT